MTVSVAMAVYNGEKYVRQQVESIMMQLGDNDEMIVSYNRSQDSTLSILEQLSKKDQRIKIYNCENKGVINNFENAIKQCKKDIVFLSDQDDVWVKNKVEIVLKEFEKKEIGGVVHGCFLVNENLEKLKKQVKYRKDHVIKWKDIIIKNSVQGCCLAFRKEMTDFFLPFPKKIPMHDSWIGMNIAINSKLMYINRPLIFYRQHEGQVTKREHQAMGKMIKDRMDLITALMKKI